jgi:hypothetical protein
MFRFGNKMTPCSFGLISRISSHPAMFFSHNKPANSAFSTINQRNEQTGRFLSNVYMVQSWSKSTRPAYEQRWRC